MMLDILQTGNEADFVNACNEMAVSYFSTGERSIYNCERLKGMLEFCF